jgi:holliday junction DNA helicase RuvA
MFGYIIGSVKYLTSNHIVLDNHGIGYIIYVANPYSYEEGKEYTVFTYNYIREDENTLYGFKTMEEKDLFLRLINVKGLGPRTALPMFATGSVNGIVDAIDRENILYLTKFPKVGEKLARQIILDLKGKLNMEHTEENTNEELVEVLLNLGYKLPDIKKILPKIDETGTIENQIKDALKLMLR